MGIRIHILTLFPDMFHSPFEESIVGRAVQAGLVRIDVHNTREYAHDRHRTVDDYPYGGGGGMVLKAGPLFELVEKINVAASELVMPVILLSPQGKRFEQAYAEKLAQYDEMVLICGRYEGVDERVRLHLATEELSIGDFVITGGELAAMVVVDSVVRLLPGALGSADSIQDDSFTSGLLQHPQYTRPMTFRGWSVPEELVSGNHKDVSRWRRQQSLLRTLERRPDLLEKAILTEEDKRFLDLNYTTGQYVVE
jgi:tRNA (guanine37-N1)-methyltransferase